MITGKPTTWQQNREKAERLTREIVRKLLEMKIDIEDTSGVMRDGGPVYGIRVFNRSGALKYTISLVPKYHKYDRRVSVDLDIYGVPRTSDETNAIISSLKPPSTLKPVLVDPDGNIYQGGKEVLIDEDDLAGTVRDVADAIAEMSRYDRR